MKREIDTAPLGIIDSLSAGFGAVAQKPILVLIPLLVDLFLWLGPRLSIATIAPSLVSQLGAVTEETADSSAALFEQNVAEILGSYNLFSALSTWPLGTPSLLAGSDLGSGPLGSPLTIKVQTQEQFLTWLITLVLTGLLLGSLYLGLIARCAGGSHMSLKAWMGLAWLYWARIVSLVLIVLMAAFLLSVPFFLAVNILAVVMAPLTSPALLAGIGVGMWGLFHLFFAAHGILLHGLGVRPAISSSVALVRRYRPAAVGLLLTAVIISLGLSTIWNIPSSESWMRLIAISGNAFINTGLATATFIFYRERTAD